MSTMKFNKVTQRSPWSWSDWISPVMKGYLMKCCDCGLVHELEFKTILKSSYKGKRIATEMPEEIQVMFRAKRRKSLSNKK